MRILIRKKLVGFIVNILAKKDRLKGVCKVSEGLVFKVAQKQL